MSSPGKGGSSPRKGRSSPWKGGSLPGKGGSSPGKGGGKKTNDENDLRTGDHHMAHRLPRRLVLGLAGDKSQKAFQNASLP